MLVKEQSKSLFPPVPQSFGALMEMYELNYIQLRLLLGDLNSLPEYSVAQVPKHVPVALTITERSKHTTSLILTYCFNSEHSIDKSYDLELRVYHDARQVEVIGRTCGIKSHSFLRGAEDSILMCRWRTNRFLFKWIRHLRRHNYKFELTSNRAST
jgi:hypothetical protein